MRQSPILTDWDRGEAYDEARQDLHANYSELPLKLFVSLLDGIIDIIL